MRQRSTSRRPRSALSRRHTRAAAPGRKWVGSARGGGRAARKARVRERTSRQRYARARARIPFAPRARAAMRTRLRARLEAATARRAEAAHAERSGHQGSARRRRRVVVVAFRPRQRGRAGAHGRARRGVPRPGCALRRGAAAAAGPLVRHGMRGGSGEQRRGPWQQEARLARAIAPRLLPLHIVCDTRGAARVSVSYWRVWTWLVASVSRSWPPWRATRRGSGCARSAPSPPPPPG